MGRHKMRSQGEEHRYNPQTIHMLQQATRDGSYEKFCEYTKMVDKEETGYLRRPDGLQLPRRLVFRLKK